MSDERVAALLDSDLPLVVIEAPAGCGKTYQGANYAIRAASRIGAGRILILTHTHAACSAFARATRETHRKVDIRTIDSLIVQIASAYHRSLGLPRDVAAWARRASGRYSELADSVARLLSCCPMISEALVARYPVVIADEHQDASAGQHVLIMAMQKAGARTRVFGDPMQSLYREETQSATKAARGCWIELKRTGAYDELKYPHRWDDGSPELGRWVLRARDALMAGRPVDLGDPLPPGLKVMAVKNRALKRSGFVLHNEDRTPLDDVVDSAPTFLILTGENETASSLRAFWNRRYPIWEGHTRDSLGELVASIVDNRGDAAAIADATVCFFSSVAAGFSASTHGNRLVREVGEGCAGRCRNKPAQLQRLGRFILEQPDHVGVVKCLRELSELVEQKVKGFDQIKIDHRQEFKDPLRLIDFGDPEEGLAEIARRRSFVHPTPQSKAISTIHKAKGFQCAHVIVVPCDRKRFSGTEYSRCKLYVALSRASSSLTLVTSLDDPGPLFRFGGSP